MAANQHFAKSEGENKRAEVSEKCCKSFIINICTYTLQIKDNTASKSSKLIFLINCNLIINRMRLQIHHKSPFLQRIHTMQVASKPFTTPAVAAKPIGNHRVAVVAPRATTTDAAAAPLNRRHFAALFTAVPALISALPAAALIPDDDDEELIEKARANRRAKLADEKKTEREFARSEGFSDKALEKNLIPVQRAINALARTGAALESGDASAAASALADGWQSDFEAATKTLSDNDLSRGSVSSVIASIQTLESNARKGALGDAKSSFVASVVALQKWAKDAGIAQSLKGL